MAPRKKTPDVMGELLVGHARAAPQPQAIPPVKQQTSLPVDQQDGEKVKATYYLSPHTLDALEAAKLQLRRLARRKKRAISSSAIVDAALKMALADLEAGGADSALASMLTNQQNSIPVNQ
jgi:hypothetical protein